MKEQGCASGQHPIGRVRLTVEESFEAVRISARVARIDAEFASCPGNPLLPMVVTLDAPLGDRELLDGITGEQPTVGRRRFAPRISVRAVPELPLTAVAGVVVTAQDRWPSEVSCGAAPAVHVPIGGPFQLDFRNEEDVLATGVVGVGAPDDRYFKFADIEPMADRVAYAQYLDGLPVRLLRLDQGEAGWRGTLSACLELPDDWTPDAAPPDFPSVDDPRAFEASADLVDLLDGIPGLRGEVWRFADPASRCAAWIPIEEALQADGWRFQGRRHSPDWPSDLTVRPLELRRQVSLHPVRGAERGTITTVGEDTLTLTTEASSPDLVSVVGEPVLSRVSQCLLDQPLSVTTSP